MKLPEYAVSAASKIVVVAQGSRKLTSDSQVVVTSDPQSMEEQPTLM